MITTPNQSLASLAHLLRLVSPTLPVGAYSYSQGLEWAVEGGIITDEPTAHRWISDALTFVVGRFEAPVLARLFRAWQSKDFLGIRYWNDRLLVSRETAELRAETVQMGYSLKRLCLDRLQISTPGDEALAALEPCSFPAAFAFAATRAGVSESNTILGFLWSWCENQVMAALKSVPLGQSAGQRLLTGLIDCLPSLVERITTMADDDVANFAPAFAIASCRHELQYSRLFRS
jgi:urease accessory protein